MPPRYAFHCIYICIYAICRGSPFGLKLVFAQGNTRSLRSAEDPFQGGSFRVLRVARVSPHWGSLKGSLYLPGLLQGESLGGRGDGGGRPRVGASRVPPLPPLPLLDSKSPLGPPPGGPVRGARGLFAAFNSCTIRRLAVAWCFLLPWA